MGPFRRGARFVGAPHGEYRCASMGSDKGQRQAIAKLRSVRAALAAKRIRLPCARRFDLPFGSSCWPPSLPLHGDAPGQHLAAQPLTSEAWLRRSLHASKYHRSPCMFHPCVGILILARCLRAPVADIRLALDALDCVLCSAGCLDVPCDTCGWIACDMSGITGVVCFCSGPAPLYWRYVGAARWCLHALGF